MTPLEALLRELIAAEGPIGVDRYMAIALTHPVHGYYATRDPLGAKGDFTTAPEISQMFGELLGLWAAEVWAAMRRPERVRLVELGPGRGTLMSDALRAARVLPGFIDAIEVHLVETSPVLREVQARTLATSGVPVAWHERFDAVPPGPLIVLANEFFDALPVRQFMRAEDGWRERLVGLGEDGRLLFGLTPAAERRLDQPGKLGDVLELGGAALALAQELAKRLTAEGGAALILDYGHVRSGFGDTLQAVRAHAYADPLADPGEADLTAHVDFAALGRAAGRAGAALHGPVPQGAFLRALGIEARAARLNLNASPERAPAVDAALQRLTGPGERQMGTLFKALGLSHPDLGSLPGLPPAQPEAVSAGELEPAC